MIFQLIDLLNFLYRRLKSQDIKEINLEGGEQEDSLAGTEFLSESPKMIKQMSSDTQ